jgi:hypothetical protein
MRHVCRTFNFSGTTRSYGRHGLCGAIISIAGALLEILPDDLETCNDHTTFRIPASYTTTVTYPQVSLYSNLR